MKRMWVEVPVPASVAGELGPFIGSGLMEFDDNGGRILATVIEADGVYDAIVTGGPIIPPQATKEQAKRYCEVVLGLRGE